jgi:hypothetical protein
MRGMGSPHRPRMIRECAPKVSNGEQWAGEGPCNKPVQGPLEGGVDGGQMVGSERRR